MADSPPALSLCLSTIRLSATSRSWQGISSSQHGWPLHFLFLFHLLLSFPVTATSGLASPNAVLLSPPAVKPLPLSPLSPQASTLVGGPGERQALELRVRGMEEENRALRKELSKPPRSPQGRPHHGNRHGNQSRTHSEEGTGDNEGLKSGAAGNGSDCAQQPPVDKCEVSHEPPGLGVAIGNVHLKGKERPPCLAAEQSTRVKKTKHLFLHNSQ